MELDVQVDNPIRVPYTPKNPVSATDTLSCALAHSIVNCIYNCDLRQYRRTGGKCGETEETLTQRAFYVLQALLNPGLSCLSLPVTVCIDM